MYIFEIIQKIKKFIFFSSTASLISITILSYLLIVEMYYRRWTRMHLKPGMKYFVKYGVLNPQYDRYTYLMAQENPEALQYRPHHQKRYIDKDLDTKLIENLFLKYPDLKFEPVSQNTYPGREFNTFSYAYAFINEQKKLIKQGYTASKAFEITESKYHEKMQRKLDQTLLSRGLAVGNRARSFLNVYQQQAEYESRLKTQRTQRELEKYQMKLRAIREMAESDTGAEGILNEEALSYNRIFYNIKQYNKDIDHNQAVTEVGHEEIPKGDVKERYEFVNQLEGKFKNLFNQFYEHAASKDKLEGLTDSEILSQVQSSPSKVKRQMRQLILYLKSKNIKVVLVNGKIEVRGDDKKLITDEIKNNKYLKIALLSETLNYQKPKFSKVVNPTSNPQLAKQIIKHNYILKDNKPEQFSKEDKETIKQNKKKEMELVAADDLYFSREAYKVYETQEERLLRLEVKYYQKLVDDIFRRKITDPTEDQKAQWERDLKEAEEKRKSTILDFRRLKYRLERRYKDVTAQNLLFPEHEQMGKALRFEDEVQYEELIGYLRKKSQDRRLTSLDQSKDNKIAKSIRILHLAEAAVPEGAAISRSE